MSAREHELYSDEVFQILNAIAQKIGANATGNLIDDLISGEQERDLLAFFLLSGQADEVYKKDPSLKDYDHWFKCTLNTSMPHTKQAECIPFALQIKTRLKAKLN